MIIRFFDDYSLEVNLKKCPSETPGELFHLIIISHSNALNTSNKQEYFLGREQLKQFTEYFNEVSRDYI